MEARAVGAAVAGVVQNAVFFRFESKGRQQGIDGGSVPEEVRVVGDDHEAASPRDPVSEAGDFFRSPREGGGDHPEFRVFVYGGEVGDVGAADDFFDQVVGVLRPDGEGMVVRLGDAPVTPFPVGDFGGSE